MSTNTAVDQSKICKITNSSTSEIVIALPLTKSDSQSAGSTVSSSGDFEILPLVSGKTSIPAAGSDSVTLDRQKTSSTGKVTESVTYDVLASTATWLTPITNVGVAQDFDDDGNFLYDPITISADSKTAMQQTVDFYQTISSHPDSELARKYVAAMGGTSDDAVNAADGSADSGAKVSSSIAKGVAAFFAGTTNYKKVTLAEIVAVEQYYNRFPFVWAQFKDAVKYYLYSSDGKQTSFQGILSIAGGKIDITKPNAGYAISFLPAVTPADTSKLDVDSSKSKTMNYSSGVFTDDANADLPAIALKGCFQLKRTFTKDPNDIQVIPVITGTINGQTVLGFDGSQATTPDDTTQDWLNSLFHPKTAEGIFNSVMQILGALMMLHFVVTTLWGIGKWIKEKATAKEPVTKEDLAKEKSNTETEIKAEQKAALDKVSNDKATLPEDSTSAVDSATTAKNSLSDQVSSSQIETNMRKMNQNIEDMEPYVAESDELSGRLDTLGQDIREVVGKLNGEISDLRAVIEELRPQLKTMSEGMAQVTSDIQTQVAQQQGDDISQSVEDMNKIQTETENESKTSEDEESDANSDDPEADPVEFPDL